MTSPFLSDRLLAVFRQRFLQFYLTHQLSLPHSSGLLAVSGGLDSTLLMHVFCHLREEIQWSKLTVMTFDHGLRSESFEEVRWVQEQGEALGLTVLVKTLSLSREGASLQNRARQARREALETYAKQEGLGWIATGHHLDDQAETVLMRLLRGTSPEGLAGIRPRQGRWIRPLLPFRREELHSVAEALKMEWLEDPSNQSLLYRRSSLRHQWLPALEEAFNPRWSEHLAALASEQQEDEDFWASVLEQTLQPPMITTVMSGIEIDLRFWTTLSAAVQRRGMKKLVQQVAGGMLQRVHLQSLLQLALESHGAIEQSFPAASGPLVVRREYHRMLLLREKRKLSAGLAMDVVIEKAGVWEFEQGRLRIEWCEEGRSVQKSLLTSRTLWEIFWPSEKQVLPEFRFRCRQPGDRLARSKGGTRSLKRWWISKKIPGPYREHWPLLEVAGVVHWVPGLRFTPSDLEKEARSGWHLCFEPAESLTKTVQNLACVEDAASVLTEAAEEGKTS